LIYDTQQLQIVEKARKLAMVLTTLSGCRGICIAAVFSHKY
jgi:hypothetical protein